MNIYALSSGRGPSGIAIVRISGKSTLQVCKNLTKLELQKMMGLATMKTKLIIVNFMSLVAIIL